MELDSRIIKGKTYLDCFDTETAKQFIGKECYATDRVSSFAYIDTLNKGTLANVDDGACNPYRVEGDGWTHTTTFILPCEWVKNELKYRPYTDNEFLTLFDLGKFHSIRITGQPYTRTVITSIYQSKDGILYVKLNGDEDGYGVSWLFKHCEYFNGEEWRPFGIKDEVKNDS